MGGQWGNVLDTSWVQARPVNRRHDHFERGRVVVGVILLQGLLLIEV